MLKDSIGWGFDRGPVGLASLCFIMMSSAEKTVRLGETQCLAAGIIWGCVQSHIWCLGWNDSKIKLDNQSTYMWLFHVAWLLHNMTASGESHWVPRMNIPANQVKAVFWLRLWSYAMPFAPHYRVKQSQTHSDSRGGNTPPLLMEAVAELTLSKSKQNEKYCCSHFEKYNLLSLKSLENAISEPVPGYNRL